MLCGLGLRESVEPKMQTGKKNIYSKHVGICHTVTYMAARNFILIGYQWLEDINFLPRFLFNKKKYPRKSKPVQVGVKTEKSLEHTWAYIFQLCTYIYMYTQYHSTLVIFPKYDQ